MAASTSTESTLSPTNGTASEKPQRSGGTRLPTLNQLAARISERSPNAVTGPSPSNSRPRLPAALLARTNSSQGTQPTSAGSSATSPDSSLNDGVTSIAEQLAATTLGGGTNEKLSDEVLSSSSQPLPPTHHEKAPRGYKNVPSLDAITERLVGMGRARSSDSVPKHLPDKDVAAPDMKKAATAPEQSEPSGDLEDGEISEELDAEKASPKQEGHPLQHTWTLYHDSKPRLPTSTLNQPSTGEQSPYVHPPNTASGEYEAGLTTVGEFNTVEDFCRYFNWLKPPSQLERNSNYHLFKDGIKPMWEDPANANGGRWVLTMRGTPELLDRCWNWLAMALVGEELDERDEICGAVVSLRAKIDRIQLWIRSKDDIERVNSVAKKLIKLLDLGKEPGIGLEFQYNTEDRPTHSKFIQITPSNQGGSYFRSRTGAAPQSAVSEPGEIPASAPGFNGFGTPGGGSAFGSFSSSTALGGGAGGWRSRNFGSGTLGTPVSTTSTGRGGGSGFLNHGRSSSTSGSAAATSGGTAPST